MGPFMMFTVLVFMHLMRIVSGDHRELYIVYMGDSINIDRSAASSLHSSILADIVGERDLSDILLHSYHRSLNGFLARLHKEEADALADLNNVVSVFPNGLNQLHTTRSWDFLKFPQDVATSTAESDIIIGMLDSGIWPESPSFDATGYGPPPAKWNGSCEAGVTCTNKIVGARYYRKVGWYSEGDQPSPRDYEGHGTHTASTAAGSAVEGASLYGLASGTARGRTPRARIASYKVCWRDGCYDADILNAFDDAVADGVDIISLSVGPFYPQDYFSNSMAIGAFHAMKNGILTSMSAGNSGPYWSSILNFAPWSLSVAASSIDRNFMTEVQLGDDNIYKGISINTFDLQNEMHPLIIDGMPYSSSNMTSFSTGLCNKITSNASIMVGKVLLCDSNLSTEVEARLAAVGAAGLLIQTKILPDVARPYMLPASCIGQAEGDDIRKYAYSSSNPTARIFKSHEMNDPLAPYVVSFSSRGPNPKTPNILKPDVAAPGANILAAWSPVSSITRGTGDRRLVSFNIISGTSMACPHVTGAAAYVKSFHPNWSPAAIKSAIMTTTFIMDPKKNLDAEFAYGAGLVNPGMAVDPGLVYDLLPLDYVKLLCAEGYTTDQLLRVAGNETPACSELGNETVHDFNYPSFALHTPLEYVDQEFRRRLTNVGLSGSTYKATVSIAAKTNLQIRVLPDVLSFTAVGQELVFTLRVTGRLDRQLLSAALVWDDGVHRVRSPIVVYSNHSRGQQASCSQTLHMFGNNSMFLVFFLSVAVRLFLVLFCYN